MLPHEEENRSGGPVLDEAMAGVPEGRYGGIVVDKLDRLEQTMHASKVLNELDDHGASLALAGSSAKEAQLLLDLVRAIVNTTGSAVRRSPGSAI
jgi:hypothetical protein